MQSDISLRKSPAAELAAGQLRVTEHFLMNSPVKDFSSDQLPLASAATNTTVAFWSEDSNGATLPEGDDSQADSRASENSFIYVVDDMPCLVELYALVLKATGHRVKTFSNRHTALAALKTEPEKPALLITDFRNTTMSTDRFLQECVEAHPKLRILMASGFGRNHAWISSVTPDRFLQKPFTPEQLQREVRSTLAGTP
jgi:CheY-like chemotaxis protein